MGLLEHETLQRIGEYTLLIADDRPKRLVFFPFLSLLLTRNQRVSIPCPSSDDTKKKVEK